MSAAPVFSFDDGPSEWTEPILDLLAKHGARGAFFVTGANTLWRDKRVERAHTDGHIVGVHGYSHRRMTTLPDDQLREELLATIALVQSATGARPPLFRGPFFGVDERVLALAADLGLEHYGADVVPNDWMAKDPELLAAVVLERLAPDAVVSLHDGIPPDGGSASCTDSRAVTVEALRLILEATA